MRRKVQGTKLNVFQGNTNEPSSGLILLLPELNLEVDKRRHLRRIYRAGNGSSPAVCPAKRGNAGPQGLPNAPGTGTSRLHKHFTFSNTIN